MSAGLQREKSLEQSKAQLQLDWEGRMEEVERKAYGKHQNIIQQLTQAKVKVGKLRFTTLHTCKSDRYYSRPQAHSQCFNGNGPGDEAR